MKIDSHQHFWRYDPVRYSWIGESMAEIRKDFLPEDLAPLLEQHGFDGCVAVQADQSEKETVFLLSLAEKFPFIKGVVGWIDLNSPDVETRLTVFSANSKWKGLRHTVYDKKGEFLLDSSFQNGISLLKNFGLTYDLLVFDYQLPGAIELVKKFPQQPFVLDHMAKPQISPGISESWKSNIQNLAKNENVFCKISGLVTETKNFDWKREDFNPFLEVVYDAFGEERLLFGSDWPVCLSAASYDDTVKTVSGFCSKKGIKVENIFGLNAAKFYNL